MIPAVALSDIKVGVKETRLLLNDSSSKCNEKTSAGNSQVS